MASRQIGAKKKVLEMGEIDHWLIGHRPERESAGQAVLRVETHVSVRVELELRWILSSALMLRVDRHPVQFPVAKNFIGPIKVVDCHHDHGNMRHRPIRIFVHLLRDLNHVHRPTFLPL